MKYRCPNCKEIGDEDICPECGILTEPLSEETLTALEEALAAPPPPPPPPPPVEVPPPPPDDPPPLFASDEPTDVFEIPPLPVETVPAETVPAEAVPAEEVHFEPPAIEAAPAVEAPVVDVPPVVAAPPPAQPEPVEPRLIEAEPEPFGPPQHDLLGQDSASPGGRPVSGPLIPQAGQQQLAQYVEDGYDVYLIAGIAAAGKTQLLDAYRKDAFLSSFTKRKGHALPTSPNQLDCHPISIGRRKVVFVDTSGEHFKRLYPHLSPTGEISEPEIDFLRLLSRRLSGLILLIDLQRLWTPALRTNPEDEAQVEILAWILILLRWLHQGGEYGANRLRFQDHVNREVMRYRRRLKPPVLVLFSRADELIDMPIPEDSGRALFPVGENPLLLAHHRLPQLLQVLETHVEHFRFDFVHSLVTDRDTGEIVDPNACGVGLSLAWLLDTAWRWPSVPTRYWIALQQFLDARRGQGELWERLPEPEDVM